MSLIDYISCPQCGFIARYWYSKFEQYTEIDCVVCGLLYRRIAIIDRKRRGEASEYRDNYKRTKEGRIIYRKYERNGYGAYCLTNKDCVEEFRGFFKPITSLDIDRFKAKLVSPDIDPEESFMTIWNEKINQIEAIFGTVRNVDDCNQIVKIEKSAKWFDLQDLLVNEDDRFNEGNQQS